MIGLYITSKLLQPKRKKGLFKDWKSPFPIFFSTVIDFAQKYNPDHEFTKHGEKIVNAFKLKEDAFDLREVISFLNEDFYASMDSKYSPTSENLDKFISNVGFANISLKSSNKHLINIDRLKAFAANVRLSDEAKKAPRFKVILPNSADEYGQISEIFMPDVSKDSATFGGENLKCTENRILNSIPILIKDKNLIGEIEMYTERVPCKSCSKVISRFMEYYPKINMTIYFTYIEANETDEDVQVILNSGANLIRVRKTKSLEKINAT